MQKPVHLSSSLGTWPPPNWLSEEAAHCTGGKLLGKTLPLTQSQALPCCHSHAVVQRLMPQAQHTFCWVLELPQPAFRKPDLENPRESCWGAQLTQVSAQGASRAFMQGGCLETCVSTSEVPGQGTTHPHYTPPDFQTHSSKRSKEEIWHITVNARKTKSISVHGWTGTFFFAVTAWTYLESCGL